MRSLTQIVVRPLRVKLLMKNDSIFSFVMIISISSSFLHVKENKDYCHSCVCATGIKLSGALVNSFVVFIHVVLLSDLWQSSLKMAWFFFSPVSNCNSCAILPR